MSKIPELSSPYPVRPWLLAVVIGVAVILAGYVFFLERSREGDGRLVGPQLSEEFNAVAPPEKTHMVGGPKQVTKSHIAGISGDYSSSLSIPELRRYYDKKLTDQGWKFLRDEATTGLTKDVVVYCKGEYEAFFEVSNQSWLTYSFGVRWDSNHQLGRGPCPGPFSGPIAK